jgi:type II secretory pathway pseudopilin PulG
VIAINIKKEEAFTLIELMLTIVLISLILGVLLNLNISAWKFWRINQDNTELSQAVNLISANLDKKIRNYNIDNINTLNENRLRFEDSSGIIIFEYYLEDNKFVVEDLKNNNKKYLTNQIVSSFIIKKNSNVIDYKLLLDNGSKQFEIKNSIKPRLVN